MDEFKQEKQAGINRSVSRLNPRCRRIQNKPKTHRQHLEQIRAGSQVLYNFGGGGLIPFPDLLTPTKRHPL